MSNSYKQEGKWLSAWSGDYVMFSQTTNAGIYQCLKTCTIALPYQTSSSIQIQVYEKIVEINELMDTELLKVICQFEQNEWAIHIFK